MKISKTQYLYTFPIHRRQRSSLHFSSFDTYAYVSGPILEPVHVYHSSHLVVSPILSPQARYDKSRRLKDPAFPRCYCSSYIISGIPSFNIALPLSFTSYPNLEILARANTISRNRACVQIISRVRLRCSNSW